MKDFLFNTLMGQVTLMLVGAFLFIGFILLLMVINAQIYYEKKKKFTNNLTVNDFEWNLNTYIESIEIDNTTGIYANKNSITRNIDGETYIDIHFFDYIYSTPHSKFFSCRKTPYSTFAGNIIRTIKLRDWEEFKEAVEGVKRLQIKVYVLEAKYNGPEKKLLDKLEIYPNFYTQEYDIPNILMDNNEIRAAFKDNPNEFKESLLKVYKEYILR